MDSNDGQGAATPAREYPKLGTLTRRALRLRCPLCGESPLFRPALQCGGLGGWMHPVDGCAPCNYRYEREPGYFLLSMFGFNYLFIAVLGALVYIAMEVAGDPTTTQLVMGVVLPMPFVSFAIIRHCKALFLAMDLWFDPDGNRPRLS